MLGRIINVPRLAVLATAILVGGCQEPEAYHRPDGALMTGSGGTPDTGGFPGTGGAGTGGSAGTGGAGTGGTGTGGSGTGGIGTGGAGAGGVSMGGSGAGGSGTGGRGSGGTAGTGGRGSGGAGGAAGGTGGLAGSTGTGPCMGLCNNPVVITTQGFTSPALGILPTCHETTINIQGGECGNFVAPRTFTINGRTQNCVGSTNWTLPLPAKQNNGYCFQTTAGQNSFAYFGTF